MQDVMDSLRVMAPAAANIIVVLIGVAFAIAAVGCLIYAVNSGQFREIEEAKYRMLDAEEPGVLARSFRMRDGEEAGVLAHGRRE